MQNFIQYSLQVRALWTYLFFAFILAIWAVTTFQSVLGGTQYQSPLLFTLLAVTLATTLTGGIAGGVFGTENSRGPGQVRAAATATYVFVNATGIVTVLVGQLSQTWEMGWKLHRVETQNAITVILELLPLQPEAFFTAYLIATGCLAALSLALSAWAALGIISRPDPTPTDLANVGALSLFLLLIGMLAGTPWAPIDADTEAAMRLYGVSVIIFIAIIIFLCTLMFSLLMAHAMGKLAAILAYRSTEAVTEFDPKQFAQKVALITWAFLRGAATGIFWAAFTLGSFWIFGLLVLDHFNLGTTEFQFRYANAAFGGITLAYRIVPWVLLGAFSIFVIAAFGKAALYGLGQLVILFFVVFWRALELLFLVACRFIGSAIRHADRSVRFAIDFVWPVSAGPKVVVPRESQKNKSKAQIVDPSEPAAPLPKFEAGNLALALIGLTVGASFVIVGSIWLLSRPEGQSGDPPSELPSEEVTTDETELPTLVLEDAIIQGISLCEVLPGATQWTEGTEEGFVIGLYGCELSNRVDESSAGALVLVSVASLEVDAEAERARALRRADALAQWSSFQVPDDVTVYVLNLGMALREDAFATGWEVFGRIDGERPAVGALISPSPEGAVISISEVVEELVQILSSANAAESFTDCDLSIVKVSDEGLAILEAVPDFECGTP